MINRVEKILDQKISILQVLGNNEFSHFYTIFVGNHADEPILATGNNILIRLFSATAELSYIRLVLLYNIWKNKPFGAESYYPVHLQLHFLSDMVVPAQLIVQVKVADYAFGKFKNYLRLLYRLMLS